MEFHECLNGTTFAGTSVLGTSAWRQGLSYAATFVSSESKKKEKCQDSFLACARMGTWSTVLHAQRILGDRRPSVLDDSLQLEEAGQKDAPR